MKFFMILLVSLVSLYAKAPSLKPVDNALYTKECASCHFGYQPGLLPSQSWEYIMGSLEDHYGTDASIDENDNKELLAYLVANSSQNAMNYKRSAKITKSLEKGVLYKSLTQIPYLKEKHKDIKPWMIEQKEVGSLARCAACHKGANKAYFKDKDVEIPNYGRWEK
ncbi:diheme cytochrome c [Campylobacter iguaniorum]|uniref:diheme cytochrome c n=1 Tax=Campylobacter iguaniorum TaxID=1244531 RepID=UPI0007C88B70|nr:diheme cytochrome c [Campylobacter iguaniorum]ANE35575.1 diheme cytochrome c [Campylobacter iguaniorum]